MSIQRPARQTEPAYDRRSTRFALGLFAYLVLTFVVFGLVWRYMAPLADRVGHIEYGWLRFTIYFAVYAIVVAVIDLGVCRSFQARRREGVLRTTFLGMMTLSVAVAFYQARFGTGLSATYFLVGVLGAFAGSLFATHHYFGLVEVNAPPSPAVIDEVRRGHARVVLANDLWDHAKRAIELVLVLILIICSLPISILLAMAIWIQDPGPLLFAKIVVTRGGGSFRQLKLRSMVKDAEQETGAVPAALDDKRITWLGRALRRTHIDELPQMINIALGQMSLVGPRPERTIFVQRHLRQWPNYASRHSVRPGLAGMAAIYGDYYSVPREKLRYDLLYIKRRSLGLDLKLFVIALLASLVGVWPGMHRGRRVIIERRQEERWQRAYLALHGADASDTEEAVVYRGDGRPDPNPNYMVSDSRSSLPEERRPSTPHP